MHGRLAALRLGEALDPRLDPDRALEGLLEAFGNVTGALAAKPP